MMTYNRIRIWIISLGLLLSTFVHAQSYLGFTTTQVNLRTGPGTDYPIIKALSPNSDIFIISSIPEGDFYNVVDISTNKEGFVHKSFVRLKELVKPNEEGLFTPIGSTNQYNSELNVTNNTSITLTLKLNDITYSFNPRETKVISVSPGNYKYRASAPGVIPDIGAENIQSGTSYSWTFYIVTR